MNPETSQQKQTLQTLELAHSLLVDTILTLSRPVWGPQPGLMEQQVQQHKLLREIREAITKLKGSDRTGKKAAG